MRRADDEQDNQRRVYFDNISIEDRPIQHTLGFDPTTTFHVFGIIIGAASLALCNRADRGSLFEQMPRTRALFYLLLAFFFFVYSIPHFGQREHLMIMLVMPYLVLAAERRGQRHVGAKLAATIGLFCWTRNVAKKAIAAIKRIGKSGDLRSRRR